jgi:hypothetical protein
MNNQTQTSNTPDQAGVFLSLDGQWIKIIYQGKTLRVLHRNFFLKLLDIPFTPKSQEAGTQQ